MEPFSQLERAYSLAERIKRPQQKPGLLTRHDDAAVGVLESPQILKDRPRHTQLLRLPPQRRDQRAPFDRTRRCQSRPGIAGRHTEQVGEVVV